MRRILLPLLCLFLLPLAGCGGGQADVPESAVIEGVTYRTGFYGDLYPMFGQVGNIGSETLRKEPVYNVGRNEFRRVDYEGHDWVHSYIGEFGGGMVYCAEAEWERMRDYYADPSNFDYYYGIGYYISETAVGIPEIDLQKFDELVAFGSENEYKPFDKRSNEKVMEKTRKIPKSGFNESVCFYKISNDGYFESFQTPRYFVYGGELLLVFYHDGGSRNGGVEEVVAVDVPDELGQYFIRLMELYPRVEG